MAQPAGRNRTLSATPRRRLSAWRAGLLACLALLTAISGAAGAAAGSVISGAYTVRYSAVNSMQIPPEVARANGIERSGDTAVVMVTLQRPTQDKPLNAVPAEVSGHARTLMGERRPLTFERVESAGSVYSLAQLPIENDQTVTLDLEVSAVNDTAVIPVTFTQRFFTIPAE